VRSALRRRELGEVAVETERIVTPMRCGTEDGAGGDHPQREHMISCIDVPEIWTSCRSRNSEPPARRQMSARDRGG